MNANGGEPVRVPMVKVPVRLIFSRVVSPKTKGELTRNSVKVSTDSSSFFMGASSFILMVQ